MTRSLPIFMALGAFIALGSSVASAQDTESLKVNVPFAFQAGRALLPAGEYEVRFDNAEEPGVLRLRSRDGRESAFVLAGKADVPKGSDQPRLVFDKDGSRYVLNEVVDPDAGQALQIVGTHPSAKSERDERPTD